MGLMKKYSIKTAREDIYRFFTESDKENNAGIGRAMFFLDDISDKGDYAHAVSSIALHIYVKASLGSSYAWKSVKRRMREFNNKNIDAILGVIRATEAVSTS